MLRRHGPPRGQRGLALSPSEQSLPGAHKTCPQILEAHSEVEHNLPLVPDQKFQNSSVPILETVRAECISVSSRKVCGG